MARVRSIPPWLDKKKLCLDENQVLLKIMGHILVQSGCFATPQFNQLWSGQQNRKVLVLIRRHG